MTENNNQLMFEGRALSEDGWSSQRDAYRIWAKRPDDTKVRCLVSREALEDHFPEDDPEESPSPDTLAQLRDRLQVLAGRNRFSGPTDDFQGLDLILTTADL